RPVIDLNPEIITAPVVRTENLIIILPLDPRALIVEPSDGSNKFSSGVEKILKVTADYSTGAAYPLAPYATETNWFKNRLNITLDPILPGDVITEPGSNLLPSVTLLAELDREVAVIHFVRDYPSDENLLLQSNTLALEPFGGSVSNLPPNLTAVTAQPSSGRSPLTVTFNATGAFDQDGSIISYEWNFGNPDVPLGGIEEGAIVVHMYGSPGTRTAVLTVKDDGIPQNTVQKQFSIDVRSNQPPVAIIAPIAVTSGMAPFTVQFDGTQSYDPDGSIVEFRWDFGEGLPSFLAAPEYTFVNEGDYLVTLRVTDNGPSPPKYSEDSIWIHVLPESTNRAPVAGFTADPESGSAPLTVQFDSSLSYDPDGQNLSYLWYFGDIGVIGGGQSTEANPVYTYNQAQVATVTLQVTDDDPYYPLDNSIQKIIEVTEITNQNPVALFQMIPDSGQPPLSVTFDASNSYDPDGNITGYSWDFGDLTNAFGAIVEHDYPNEGVWTVTLTIADNSNPPGTGQAFDEVVVGNTRPVAVIFNDVDNGYVPLTVHFDATGSSDADGDNLTYHWDFGDSNESISAIVDHEFTLFGNYTVILTVTDDHGAPKNLEDTDSVLITVERPPPNQPPVVIIDTDQYYGSAPLTVQFDSSQSYDPDGDNIVEYFWDFGDGVGQSFNPAPQYTFNDQGEYMVALRLTDDGVPPASGLLFQGIYVDVNVPPVSVPEADVTEGEQPLTVQFTGENSYDPDGSVVSYFWNFSTGDNSDAVNPLYTFIDAGEFSVLLQVADDNIPPGLGFKPIVITVLPSTTNQPPTAVIIANPTNGPAPLRVNFSANSSTDPDGTIIAVLWNFGDPDIPGGGESTDFVTSHIYESSGNFVVTLTVWDDGTPQLTDMDSVMISVL
ncbi:MAG: PKD domain-containing protein, partial [bacterium]